MFPLSGFLGTSILSLHPSLSMNGLFRIPPLEFRMRNLIDWQETDDDRVGKASELPKNWTPYGLEVDNKC
jgi:hypothetical protein